MSIIGGLDLGKRALMAQAQAIKVNGQNITNANTPGYSRQRIEVKNSIHTKDESINLLESRRIRDRFIDKSLRNEYQSFGNWDMKTQLLTRIEDIFNEPSDNGINKILGEFWNSWEDLSNYPEGNTQRAMVVQRGVALAQAINRVDSNLNDIEKNVDGYINDRISQINTLASQIAHLNSKIVFSEAGGQEASGMRDNRDLLIDKLSKMVNITVSDRGNSSVAIYVGGTALVDDATYNTMTIDSSSNTGNVKILWSSSKTNVNINNGELSGLLDLRNDIIPGLRKQVNQFASTLASEVNRLHESGYGLDRTTGVKFFSEIDLFSMSLDLEDDLNNGTVTSDLKKEFSNKGISLSGSATIYVDHPTNGRWRVVDEGIVYTIRKESGQLKVYTATSAKIAVNEDLLKDYRLVAAADDIDENGNPEIPQPGDNGTALKIAALADETLAPIGTSLGKHYSNMVNALAGKSQHADIMRQSTELLVNDLEEQKESVSGVSLDEEMADLIKLQKIYEAASQYMSIINNMLGVLMNMGR